jgi:hypothetical protein
MSLRVAHNGTGLTGREALRGIINDPDLELVGVLTSTPSKAGIDAGTLAGLTEIGLTATDDFDDILAAGPDCFCYCATAVRREEDAIDDISRLLRAGINVVTIATIPMIYPPAAPERWRQTITEACRAGGTSFYATGSEPGVGSLNIPTALLASAGQVDAYRMDIYALGLDVVYPIWDVLHESMGFGKPDGHVPVRIASGKVRKDWETVVRYIADLLAIDLDSVELDWETVTTPTDLQSEIGVVPAGTICAHRWRLSGIVGGESVVAAQYFATLSTTPWPAAWPRPANDTTSALVYRVEGRPNLRMQLYFDPQSGEERLNSAIPLTAMAAVNAIPAVVRADPGIITQPLHGPEIVSRQAKAARVTAAP